MKKILRITLIFGLIVYTTTGCKYDKQDPQFNGYPDDVGKIMLLKCAVSGCHNTVSASGAAGLDLSTWDKLFEGSRYHNAAVVPYSHDFSFLLSSINSYPDLGSQLKPLMPVNNTQLTRDEIILLRNWVANGAPDKNGNVKWAGDLNRKKIYVANQGCDQVSVFDVDTRHLIRYVSVGVSPAIEVPHSLTVSPDKNFWYVTFVGNSIIEKYRCSDDTKVGQIDLGDLGWHTMSITADSRIGLAVNLSGDGKVSLIDLETMTLIQKYQGSGLFRFPHGCVINQNGTIAYVTASLGNFIYKLNITDPLNPDITELVLRAGDTPNAANHQFSPHQIRFSPDYSRYYVSAESADEIRVYNAANDSLITCIPTCEDPEEMVFSLTTPYMFVSSYQDSSHFAPNQGCISVLNYETNTFIKNIYSGYQPHQMVIDDEKGYVLIANRNISTTGPAPHHTSVCGGRNGYVTAIDLSTLELLPDFKVEVSVDPYCVDIRK